MLEADEKLRSKRAHRDRGVGEGVLRGRADHWWDSPSRAGTRTATSRKLTHTELENEREKVCPPLKQKVKARKEMRSGARKLFATYLEIVADFMSPGSRFV